MLILQDVKRLYDGSSAGADAVHEGVDVFIDGGSIHEIAPHDPSLVIGDGHTAVDAAQFTVTPGLVDCHGHVTVLGLEAGDMEIANSQAGILYVEKILHTSLVDGGVTTMRDVGGATQFMKRMVDTGVMIGPRLEIAICMLSTTGGHADFRGPDRCHGTISKLWGEAPGRPSSIVDGPWECRKRVREIKACGADLIKICSSPGVASPSDALEHRDFTPEEVAAICDEAAARGMKVASHAHSRSGIELAITNGVSDIQHISWMDERLAEMAYERGCTVTPTSWVLQELPHAEGLSPFVMQKVEQAAEVHAQAVEHARKNGLTILAGTDPVLPGMHGRNFMEIVALVRDGLHPLHAWHAMTGAAAAALGRDETGVLAAGRRADLVLWDGDVLGDPALMDGGAIVEVVKDGEGYREGVAGIPQRTFRSGVAAALEGKHA